MVRRQVSFRDRAEIATGLKAGWSLRRIAAHVGWDVSVILREVARNSTKTRGYQMVTADVQARKRRCRPQPRKVAADPVLRARVLADLTRSRTPRQIAGRLKLEAASVTVEHVTGFSPAGGRTVSHEAIYQFIDAMPQPQLVKFGVVLQSKRTSRRPRTSNRRGAPIVGMRSIHERETDYPGVEERRVPGHLEGDLVMGAHNQSAVMTLVERMSRSMVMLALPHGKDSDAVADSLIDHVSELPRMMRKSWTWDQGTEMAKHAAVTLATDLKIYFAHPRSPWQRPSNETPPSTPCRGCPASRSWQVFRGWKGGGRRVGVA